MTGSGGREVVIGLDVGTSSVKAVVFEIGATWNRATVRRLETVSSQPGRQEQDPGVTLVRVMGALGGCRAALGDRPVAGISVATAMHGLLGLDVQLRPTTPLITWADSRATAEAAALRDTPAGVGLARRSGVPIHPMTPLAKLQWFAAHEPATMAATRWWVGLKDWVLLLLTDELVTDLSSASGTGLLDAQARAWDREAVALAGITVEQLPPIRPTTAVLPMGTKAAEMFSLPVGLPIVVGAADGPTANLGCGALDPGVAGLSIGTSGALRMAVDGPQPDRPPSLFCYALTDDVWVAGGAISNGGSVAGWAADAFVPTMADATIGVVEDALLTLAATVPAGCDGLVMLPYLTAERAPLWDPSVPGAYLGLRAHHTRAHLARAAIEGVALQLRLVLDQLEQLGPVDEVLATGGALAQPLWRAVVAAMFERPVRDVGDVEGTARGAAMLALVALGRAPDLRAAIELLAWSGVGGGVPIAVDPGAVEAYRRLRASVPGLVEGLGRTAALYRDG